MCVRISSYLGMVIGSVRGSRGRICTGGTGIVGTIVEIDEAGHPRVDRSADARGHVHGGHHGVVVRVGVHLEGLVAFGVGRLVGGGGYGRCRT
jgi:hypothetical protein